MQLNLVNATGYFRDGDLFKHRNTGMTRGMAWQDILVRSTILPRSQSYFAMSLPASHKREKAPVNERVEILQDTTGKRDAGQEASEPTMTQVMIFIYFSNRISAISSSYLNTGIREKVSGV